MTEHKRKMTEDETIYCLKAGSERYPQVCEECQLYGQTGCDHCYDDANDVAIKALEEIQQYRALGLTPELIEAMQGHNIAMINDLAEYQALGTVEELRVARDKQVAKKVIPRHIKKYDGFDDGECPTCGNSVLRDGFSNDVYCDECGQKLDWSDEDDI